MESKHEDTSETNGMIGDRGYECLREIIDFDFCSCVIMIITDIGAHHREQH